MRNDSTNFPRKLWQLRENKEIKFVESNEKKMASFKQEKLEKPVDLYKILVCE